MIGRGQSLGSGKVRSVGINLCRLEGLKISGVMERRECDLGEICVEQAVGRMRKVLEIMRQSVMTPLKSPVKSMGRQRDLELRLPVLDCQKGSTADWPAAGFRVLQRRCGFERKRLLQVIPQFDFFKKDAILYK